jgi:drug/metabolite transporter (DMT)-like permease
MKNIDIKWLYLIILSVIWGSSFILIKKALIGLTPFQLGGLRTVLTASILLTLGYNSLKSIKKDQWKWIALSGFLGSFFPAFLFAIAETEIDSGVTSVLNSLVPLNTVLMGFAIFKITSTRRQVIGVIIGFIGTAILIFEGSDINPNQNYLYAGFIIVSTLMYAANVNIIKRYLQEVKPLPIAAGNYVFISIPAFIILVLSGFFSEETFEKDTVWNAILYVAILAVFGTALAKILFNRLIQMSSPVFATSVTYLMPLVALFWGLLDGETFSPMQGFATLVILTGVYIANRKRA